MGWVQGGEGGTPWGASALMGKFSKVMGLRGAPHVPSLTVGNPDIPVYIAYPVYPVTTGSTSPGITMSHARHCHRFTEKKINLTRKKLLRTNQGSHFLGGTFRNRVNVTASVHFRREKSKHLKRWSIHIFISKAPEL